MNSYFDLIFYSAIPETCNPIEIGIKKPANFDRFLIIKNSFILLLSSLLLSGYNECQSE
jgi:hypothetical protein